MTTPQERDQQAASAAGTAAESGDAAAVREIIRRREGEIDGGD